MTRSRGWYWPHFFAAGFQFCSSVIGAWALSSSVLIRNRPSGATSYCRPCQAVRVRRQRRRQNLDCDLAFQFRVRRRLRDAPGSAPW
jgi:hypothetical protein